MNTLVAPPPADFDRFLYAPVGADRHGGLLSVLSALARLGVDPWEQAATLARLPMDKAALALSALLANLPAVIREPLDMVPLTRHLVSLLPRTARRPAAVAPLAVQMGDGTVPRRLWLGTLLGGLFIVVLLAAKLLLHA